QAVENPGEAASQGERGDDDQDTERLEERSKNAGRGLRRRRTGATCAPAGIRDRAPRSAAICPAGLGRRQRWRDRYGQVRDVVGDRKGRQAAGAEGGESRLKSWKRR